MQSTMDEYGFVLERSEEQKKEYQAFIGEYDSILTRRSARWKSAVSQPEDENQLRLERNRQMKRFTRKGIPRNYRHHLWMTWSGAAEEMRANPGLYQKLLKRTLDHSDIMLIEADIPRTFPENVFFRSQKNDDRPPIVNKKSHSLQNVLCAFALHRDEIGYCQGLNFIAAVFLLVINSEEKVFWLLTTLTEKILQPYYAPDMLAIQVDCNVLHHLIREKIPKVYKAMQSANLDSCLVLSKCTKWFICLYIDVLPIETVMRILDCLFYEGDKILFRIALTLIKLNESELLKCRQFPDFVNCFTAMENNQDALCCHSLLQKSFDLWGRFSRKHLNRLRAKYRAEMAANSYASPMDPPQDPKSTTT